MKKITVKSVALLILQITGLVVFFYISFFFGYKLGIHHEDDGLIFTMFKEYTKDIREKNTDMVQRDFEVSFVENGKETILKNRIFYPHSWEFSEIVNDEGKKSYVIESSDDKVSLMISPIKVDSSRSVLSSSVLLTQEITRKCVGSFNLSDESDSEFVSIYRENGSENGIKYVQEVVSENLPSSEPQKLEEFIVFDHDFASHNDEEIVWTSDITVEMHDSVQLSEKEKYLQIIDDIVASLEIQK